jgi:hypothetical protein
MSFRFWFFFCFFFAFTVSLLVLALAQWMGLDPVKLANHTPCSRVDSRRPFIFFFFFFRIFFPVSRSVEEYRSGLDPVWLGLERLLVIEFFEFLSFFSLSPLTEELLLALALVLGLALALVLGLALALVLVLTH